MIDAPGAQWACGSGRAIGYDHPAEQYGGAPRGGACGGSGDGLDPWARRVWSAGYLEDPQAAREDRLAYRSIALHDLDFLSAL